MTGPVGWGPLPKCWLTCTFVFGLPQHIRHLLRASSRMETMSTEQLLIQMRAVMTDNKGPAELAAASARQTPSELKVHNDSRKFVCYMVKDCLQNHQERPDSQMRKVQREICFPVCGWLRVAVAFIKRLATAVTKGWDDRIKNASLYHILAETLTRVQEADPVGGN